MGRFRTGPRSGGSTDLGTGHSFLSTPYIPAAVC
jgi:hypothetical protein